MALDKDTNHEIGMDEAQMAADRNGFRTNVQMVTGGMFEDLGDGAGTEVGNPYDVDEMGEEYHAVSFGGKKK